MQRQSSLKKVLSDTGITRQATSLYKVIEREPEALLTASGISRSASMVASAIKRYSTGAKDVIEEEKEVKHLTSKQLAV